MGSSLLFLPLIYMGEMFLDPLHENKMGMWLSGELSGRVRQPGGGKVKLPLVKCVWRLVWLISSADLYTFWKHSALTCLCVCVRVRVPVWVCACGLLNLCARAPFGNADRQTGSQLWRWLTQSPSTRYLSDKTKRHSWGVSMLVCVIVFALCVVLHDTLLNLIIVLCILVPELHKLCVCFGEQWIDNRARVCLCWSVFLFENNPHVSSWPLKFPRSVTQSCFSIDPQLVSCAHEFSLQALRDGNRERAKDRRGAT